MDTLDEMLDTVNLRINPAQFANLNKPATIKEVEAVLDKLPGNKAPGPDRIPYGVWTGLRATAAPALVKLFNGCKSMAQIMESAREATIILLPKEKDSHACSMYRPISLTNTDYKIIMRVWANRLGPILHSIVGGHQLGFIPGRDGRENILNTQAFIDYYVHKHIEGAVIFMDLKKAFDKVSHRALIHTMRRQGWPPDFIN